MANLLALLGSKDARSSRKAFSDFDNGTDAIAAKDVKSVLANLKQTVPPEVATHITDQVEPDSEELIEWEDFVRRLAEAKSAVSAKQREAETLEAFVALGGAQDKSGRASLETLRSIMLEFGLSAHLESNMKQLKKEDTSSVDFADFKMLLT